MEYIESKLQWHEKENLLTRERINQAFLQAEDRSGILCLYGMEGSGKTTAVQQYLKAYKQESYGYLRLDQHDNDIRCFRCYFLEMLKRTGIEVGRPNPDGNLKEAMHQVLISMQKLKTEKVLFLDEIHNLTEGEVTDELVLFLDYLPEHIKAYLGCSGAMPEYLLKLVLKNRISLLPVRKLMMSAEEIKICFANADKLLTLEQAGEILRQTGGMPAALQLMISNIEERNLQPEHVRTWHTPALDLWIKTEVWEACTGKEQELIGKGKEFPYLTEAFCQEVLEIAVDRRTLFSLEQAGILDYDVNHESYQVPEFLKGFTERAVRNKLEEGSRDLYRRAMEWYDARGEVRETLGAIRNLGDQELLKEYLIRHSKDIMHILTESELKDYLKEVLGEEDSSALIYLSALTALWDRDEQKFRELWGILERRYQNTDSHKQELGEMLVNLLYENPKISPEDWMEQAEAYVKQSGSVSIHSITGGVPSIRCGTKDLTPLFSSGIKEGRTYAKRWEGIVAAEQRQLIQLAAMDYYLVTDRKKQAWQELQEWIPALEGKWNVTQMLGLAGIICNLKQGLQQAYGYEEILGQILDQLKKSGYPLALRNLNALCLISFAWNQEKDKLAHWILQETSQGYEKITRENAYLQMIKGKGYLMLGQYAKAQIIFRRLADFYEGWGKEQFTAECLFGEAAALYELEERPKALKKAAQAITLGTPYRYIDIYTGYGKTGLALIEAYQKMTVAPEVRKVTAKKKYYYGNVLRANYEGYQNTLLRCAKREMRRSPMGDAKAGAAETLTMTESAILQYISKGYSNQEISGVLNIKVSTVKSHIYSIYRKFGVKGRVSAINRGKELGIL